MTFRVCKYIHCENSIEGMRKNALFCSVNCKSTSLTHDCASSFSRCNSLGREGRIARNRDYINLEKTKPCSDCGGSFPPVCMDFDHLPGSSKVADLATMKYRSSIDAIKAEIAKCDLVCANCHRIRTHSRREVDLDSL